MKKYFVPSTQEEVSIGDILEFEITQEEDLELLASKGLLDSYVLVKTNNISNETTHTPPPLF